MSYKVFSNGNVLNASELNEFLMNQSVIAFSNATARSSAITSPLEGMITYLEDSNSYQSYDGSAWVGLVPQSPNAIINAAFEINQRNFTSTTTNSAFGFDRWFMTAVDGTSTYSSQAFTPGSAPVSGYESANFARIVTTGQTLVTARTNLTQGIEDVRTFAGQTVTVSFFAKAATGTPSIAVELNQSFGTGGSPSGGVSTLIGKPTLSTSWQRYSVTATLPSIAGKTIGTDRNSSQVQLNVFVSAGSNLNARTGSLGIQSNTFDIWGVQLEAGSVATPFRRNANSIQGELAACQRYYVRFDGTNFWRLGTGIQRSSTAASVVVDLPVSMRVLPTSIGFSTLGGGSNQMGLYDGVTHLATTGLTLNSAARLTSKIFLDVFGTGLTTYRPVWLGANDAPNSFLEISAEL